MERFDSSRARRPPLEREVLHETTAEQLPPEALQTAIGEVRDVMVQYTNCVDP